MPDCSCDNCQFIRRFGGHIMIDLWKKCNLCGRKYSDHVDWHCPEKTEWKLRCGARVVINKNGFEFEIVSGDAPGAVNFTEIPDLIKILQKIYGSEK